MIQCPLEVKLFSRLLSVLFLTTLGKLGVLNTATSCKCIEVHIYEHPSFIGSTMMVGNIEVLYGNGYFTTERFERQSER
jgi:hypothetical protein